MHDIVALLIYFKQLTLINDNVERYVVAEHRAGGALRGPPEMLLLFLVWGRTHFIYF